MPLRLVDDVFFRRILMSYSAIHNRSNANTTGIPQSNLPLAFRCRREKEEENTLTHTLNIYRNKKSCTTAITGCVILCCWCWCNLRQMFDARAATSTTQSEKNGTTNKQNSEQQQLPRWPHSPLLLLYYTE